MTPASNPAPMNMRRILCIDGGGILGTQPAAFLASLEEDLERPIGSYFDLISGTSTGGILAIGLALGLPAKRLLDLYVDRGPNIFGQSMPGFRGRMAAMGRGFRHVFAPKHDAGILRAELDAVIGMAKIGDARTRLVIPAWDADHRSVYIYKTAHHERLTTDYKRLAADAAMATAAAPTYYRRHRTADDIGLLDGGVWANNPIAIAVAEAIGLLEWPASSLQILSLGCATEVYMLGDAPGWFNLGLDITRLFMDGQSRGALGMAKLLTGHEYKRQSIFRYSPMVPKGFFKLDDTSKITQLKGMGAGAARNAKPHVHPVFFAPGPAEPFVPLYKNKDAPP